MVLERIIPVDKLERKPWYAFLLGVLYTIISIIIAKLIFPADPALSALALLSIFLLPELRGLFSREEKQERKEKHFSLLHLWRDERDVVATYLALFFGIFSVYAVATLYLPAFSVNTLFSQQLAIRGASGLATSSSALFTALLLNNIIIFAATFLLGLLAGDGAIFFIAWNASVWGTLFGALARSASSSFHQPALVLLFTIIAIVIWHTLLEALAYIGAAISGSIISKDLESEYVPTQEFHSVFTYNIALLGIALLVLILGVGLETLVLEHSQLYLSIIHAAQ